MKTYYTRSKHDIHKIVEFILNGELIIFPTETVYGLGANAFNDSALLKIFELKGRDLSKPFTLHLSSVEEVQEVAQDIPDSFYALAEEFLPGPLTVVLNKREKIASKFISKDKTVAIRIPSHPLAKMIIKESKTPLAATSANFSGKTPLIDGTSIFDEFNDKVSAILDDGKSPIGLASTIISLVDKPKILRVGSITQQQIKDCLKIDL